MRVMVSYIIYSVNKFKWTHLSTYALVWKTCKRISGRGLPLIIERCSSEVSGSSSLMNSTTDHTHATSKYKFTQ